MEQTGQIFQLIIVGLLLVGASAFMVVRSSGKRLVRNMLLWLFAPAILMVGVMALGTLFSSGPGEPFYNIAFAVMLIGTIIVMPWMVICGAGFAIGFAIRRKHPQREPEATARPEAAGSAQPAPQTLSRPAPAVIPVDTQGSVHSDFSPDGSIRVDINPVEWAASQWASTPRVVEVQGDRILCNLLGTDWDAHVSFPRDRYIWLGLRRYRSPGYLFAEFDLAADRYRIALNSLDTADEEGPLGDVTDRLELWWERASALAASRVTKETPAVIAPHPFAAWRTALVILAGAIVAIAGLTFLSLKTGIEPPRMPSSIPHIPRVPH
ncbi:MAG: hypothetical protein AB7U35_03140 [Sphingobium sp.]